MERTKASVLMAIFLAVSQIGHVFSSPTTAPAFLWTPHDYGLSYEGAKDLVKYQTISPKDLAKSVLDEAGWSNIVCSGENGQAKVDLALVFIGRKLHSLDLSKNKQLDPVLTDTLKMSFTSSNFSMAFPYVATSDGEGTVENALLREFSETCGHGFSESLNKVNDIVAIQEYVANTMERKTEKEKTDVILFSIDGLKELDGGKSEGELLSELVSMLEKSGVRYTVLYISEPYNLSRYGTHVPLARFLEETNTSSSSNTTKCDETCQLKASLLEGLFVAITLLIILISGLCCMMGIDTPVRFETPQES
ncbi:2-C-methyl-D-erythritol 4-phosphate cytidylyltransferase [Rhynchospora pubera]|uniref:2-C-methyl-D-erythritol 4-phosphate cytidylyltransferase n=1 Tax=Rhynchospora pubera TaxID=906938 RepID=A0AAV8GX10_9POAL|nr:2-C-methyl-D-erythritol 4-phosphate cytidylyltransferase [Rhynchospora pubera]